MQVLFLHSVHNSEQHLHDMQVPSALQMLHQYGRNTQPAALADADEPLRKKRTGQADAAAGKSVLPQQELMQGGLARLLVFAMAPALSRVSLGGTARSLKHVWSRATC